MITNFEMITKFEMITNFEIRANFVAVSNQNLNTDWGTAFDI